MNSCGECTACCTSLGFTGAAEKQDSDPETTKSLGIDYQPFMLCNKVCDYGCTIYKMRPKVCREFECQYILSDLSVELRPDQCGVIAELKGEFGIVLTVLSSGVTGISSTEYRDDNKDVIKDIISEISLQRGCYYSSAWLVSKKEVIEVWI